MATETSAPDLTSNSSGSPTTVMSKMGSKMGVKLPEGVSMPGLDKATEAVNKFRDAASGAKENKEMAKRMADRCGFLAQIMKDALQGLAGEKMSDVIRTRGDVFANLLDEIVKFLDEAKSKPKWSRMFNHAKVHDTMCEYEAQIDRFCRDLTLAVMMSSLGN
ncbi:hypothetical protein M427DRAFT_147076 [Gonapodya prolifera JEL478]|uniref:Uncharacterized protein n=1 Tax=Gonapodya prolifera (strain JEL478) TaxID=1344416 RepID=A0A139A6V9_GONPJ|nr:hypothetical protein M427DRAFT_147076 [Gonapodya prolifera JEL478]|eukprot:KXS12552.1 hypothetical protein M427DRAFT_147076 [Gonapodya prolifera JEL478]